MEGCADRVGVACTRGSDVGAGCTRGSDVGVACTCSAELWAFSTPSCASCAAVGCVSVKNVIRSEPFLGWFYAGRMLIGRWYYEVCRVLELVRAISA